jgi:hypothetical protein
MNTKSFLFAGILALLLSVGAFAQGPPQGGQAGGARRGPAGPGEGRPGADRHHDWLGSLDTNKDGNIDATELQGALDRTFTALDRNGNGVIDNDEARMEPPPPAGVRRGNPRQDRPPADDTQGGRPKNDNPEGHDLLPPFFFDKALRDGATLTREQFAATVKGVFNDLDKNHDGVLSKDEVGPPRGNGPDRGPRGEGIPGTPPAPPNAQFVAAELRFGDRLVAGQPFSANTVLEDTRRLYDGSTATKSMKGAFYRDGNGRTRREQPLEMVGGVQIAGVDGQPQMMVFINDFASKTQTFLDVNNKLARTHPIGNMGPPTGAPRQPQVAKVESLGTKTIEGVKAEGTRTTFRIPAGQLSDKAIDVVTETWFSPDLQVVVMSRHVDPIAGEHVFRLTNIKLGEPSVDLFTVPQGYRVENPGERPKPE